MVEQSESGARDGRAVAERLLSGGARGESFERAAHVDARRTGGRRRPLSARPLLQLRALERARVQLLGAQAGGELEHWGEQHRAHIGRVATRTGGRSQLGRDLSPERRDPGRECRFWHAWGIMQNDELCAGVPQRAHYKVE